MKEYDVIIIGGGLAGLTAAIDLAGRKFSVLVLEKHAYPRHKVCGEYLSVEVRPYLESLGLNLDGAVPVNRFRLTTVGGQSFTRDLPLGGLGISRYKLDYTLYNKALEMGVDMARETVTGVSDCVPFNMVSTQANTFRGKVVLGAYGKRDSLDRELGRRFIKRPSPWLAVKAHYEYPAWPDDLVGLYAFPGGYAGLSKTESGAVNLCYLAGYNSFRHYGSIEEFNTRVLVRNPALKKIICEAQMLFDKPLSIAQIPFRKKMAVEKGILMCGDAAGVIHPLCGNGMAMAIHAARMASELIAENGVEDRNKLRREYHKKWNAAFSGRMAVGRVLQAILLRKHISTLCMATIAQFPWLLNQIIKGTHGKPGTP